MQETKLFSTEFSGYNKSEVVEYIAKMDREAQKKISDLEQRLEEANKKGKEKPDIKAENILLEAEKKAEIIIKDAEKKAEDIVAASRKELSENLSKTKYLYRRRESVGKELALMKKAIDEVFENLDLPSGE